VALLALVLVKPSVSPWYVEPTPLSQLERPTPYIGNVQVTERECEKFAPYLCMGLRADPVIVSDPVSGQRLFEIARELIWGGDPMPRHECEASLAYALGKVDRSIAKEAGQICADLRTQQVTPRPAGKEGSGDPEKYEWVAVDRGHHLLNALDYCARRLEYEGKECAPVRD
jgi:hypothetical protein